MNCHHRFYELKDFFAASKENGYENVEIWTGPQHFFMDHNGYKMLINFLDWKKNTISKLLAYVLNKLIRNLITWLPKIGKCRNVF